MDLGKYLNEKEVSDDEGDRLVDRWNKKDRNLSLAERVFVLEKIVRKLVK